MGNPAPRLALAELTLAAVDRKVVIWVFGLNVGESVIAYDRGGRAEAQLRGRDERSDQPHSV